jgi:hypothetical protein
MDYSDEDLERIRRSAAMLAPRHPGGLRREEAVELLEELQGHRRGWRRRAELIARLRTLLDELEGLNS